MVHGLKYAEPSTAVSCQLNLIPNHIHNAQHMLVNVYSTVLNFDLGVDTKSGQETCNQLSLRRPSRSPRRGVARVWFCCKCMTTCSKCMTTCSTKSAYAKAYISLAIVDVNAIKRKLCKNGKTVLCFIYLPCLRVTLI